MCADERDIHGSDELASIDQDDAGRLGWCLQGAFGHDPTTHAVADQHARGKESACMISATSAPQRSIGHSGAVPGLAPCLRKSTATIWWREERCAAWASQPLCAQPRQAAVEMSTPSQRSSARSERV